METVPKSMRLHIALFGRTNVGKSSFLNMISGQQAAITSPIPGTTTDVVEKTMELLPLGPVVFLDTAGIDDTSELGAERIKRGGRMGRSGGADSRRGEGTKDPGRGRRRQGRPARAGRRLPESAA